MNIPIILDAAEFTATGTALLSEHRAQAIPSKYSMQVTGVDVNGAAAAPTSWDVLLLASLDGLVYNEASKILEHVNTSQGNGDVVFSAGSFYPSLFWQVKCKALVLGATAVKIKVRILGIK